jgi:hypothetical protein
MIFNHPLNMHFDRLPHVSFNLFQRSARCVERATRSAPSSKSKHEVEGRQLTASGILHLHQEIW